MSQGKLLQFAEFAANVALQERPGSQERSGVYTPIPVATRFRN